MLKIAANGRLSAPTHASSTSFDALCGNMANGDSPPDYKPGGSAGLPVTKAENADGRKQLLNGMHRVHRIMTEEELAQGKQPRWTELEIHGEFYCFRIKREKYFFSRSLASCFFIPFLSVV